MNKRRIIIGIVVALLALLLIGAGGFVVWANQAAQPMPEAFAAMQSTSTVQFSQENGWLVYKPIGAEPTTGLVIYPGGKVDYRAYAPTAQAIAAQGHLVVIPPMPLNLAFLDTNAAEKIIAAFPQIQKWAVAGHSLGGVAASSYAANHPDKIQGVGFWASYPQGTMTTYPGQVVSISGTNDGLATPAKIEDSKTNLPASTVYVPIQGGNHAQFGYYGEQEGDNPATISRAEQQAQLVAAMVKLLQGL
jgi:hypothetical protein